MLNVLLFSWQHFYTKQSKVTVFPKDTLNFALFFCFDQFWLQQLKESFEAAVATFANPCPAVVSHLGVSCYIKVSLEGGRKFAAVSVNVSNPIKIAVKSNVFSSPDSSTGLISLWTHSFSLDLWFVPFLCGWDERTPVWLLFIALGLSGGWCLCCFCLLRWALCCAGSDSLLTSNSSSPPLVFVPTGCSSPITYGTSP